MIKVSRKFVATARHSDIAAIRTLEQAKQYFDMNWTDEEDWVPHIELVRDPSPMLTMDTRPHYWWATLTATGYIHEGPQ